MTSLPAKADAGSGDAAPAKLSVAGVEKRYGSVVALAPTDLEVRSGEFLTLLGPSGSGKTTLLMTIAGLALPDGGRIVIDGRDTTYTPVYDRDIGMVFQNYALFPHLDIFENVAFSLRVRGLAEVEITRRTHEALSLVQLDHLAQRFPKELSGGQQQRIAIARAIVYQPSIILMDEPLGALDKRLREQMQIEIKRLHRQLGVTIIYVTHDQEEALSMSDRICLMNNGGIVQLGQPAELYFAPRSLFAANFLGEANILTAQPGPGPGIASAAGTSLRFDGSPSAGGETISLLIRPECFSLGMGDGTANRLSGRLADITMLGPMTRLDVVCADGTVLIAKIPTGRAVTELVAGCEINLNCSRQDVILVGGDT
ncbi:ABC transporter ATP-binding protein [Bosea minatitlanensis]|uniref:ABC transporter ATP-binding protein n=1 Tax=Bosea minatitlanensis TaxID=128782 RepID=A0ABW0EZ05_9HYPH|nr:ABC transporter ATP-binding protein [Bosea minatitlanensis]MCT4492551.1 ABC transporter ATP-binding protein [Bosea minatitlanensis]